MTRRRTWLWSLLVVLFIAAASYGVYLYLLPPRPPAQLLYGNGHIEGTEVRVSAEIVGKVAESSLREGKTVKAGDILVRVEATELKRRRDQAKANLEAIKFTRQRIAAELQSARHHRATARRDFERYKALREKNTASAQQLEQAEDKLKEAASRVAVLEAQQKEAGARVRAAKDALRLIEVQVAKTTIAAPIDGTITTKAVEAGEYVRPGQVVAVVVDLSKIEMKVFVPEDEIGKVKLGDPARVKVDAYPDRHYAAKVVRIDQRAQFTPRDIHMPRERVRMVFGVTLAVRNDDRTLKPGMPADSWILWKRGAKWPGRLFVPQ